MDIISALFLVIVVGLGGFIAWMADRLGRYLGKKRFRFWRLRPRHTAELMTIIVGVLTPIITVTLIMAASSDVRTWLLEGRRAVQQSRELQEQVDGLESQRLKLRDEIVAKTKVVSDLDSRLKTSQSALKAAKAQAEKNLAEARIASQKADRAQAQLQKMTSELAKRQKELVLAKKAINSNQAMVKELDDKQRQLKQTIRAYEKSVNEYNLEFDRLSKANDQLGAQIDALKSGIKQITEEKERASKELQDAQDLLAKSARDYDKLVTEYTQRINKLLDHYNVLVGDVENINKSIDKSRSQPMIFACDEELGRHSLRSNLSEKEAVAALSTIMRSSRVLAEQRGAKSFPQHESVDLADIIDGKTRITPIQQMDRLVKQITYSREQLVLTVNARYNVFRGEWVPVLVTAQSNPLVYQAGDAIVEGVIDGAKTEDDIFQQISDLLRNKLVTKIQQDKMIPRTGHDDAFGTASQEKVIDIVRRIKAMGRKMRVRVEAEVDTRAADPLRIRFNLR